MMATDPSLDRCPSGAGYEQIPNAVNAAQAGAKRFNANCIYFQSSSSRIQLYRQTLREGSRDH